MATPDKNMTVHKGPRSCNREVDDFIIAEIETGISQMQPLTTARLVTRLLQKWPNHLHNNGDSATKRRRRIQQQIYRVMNRYGFSYRRPTHVAQNAHVDMEVGDQSFQSSDRS